MIDRLARSIAAAFPELHGEQLADALWLAAKYPAATEPSTLNTDAASAETALADTSEVETPADDPAGTEFSGKLALSDEEWPSTESQAMRVTKVGLRVPVTSRPMPATVTALSQFRRIRRPGPPTVDVDATVEATADVGRLTIVVRPIQQCGLDVAIVVDRTPVAMAWVDTIDEFAATLRRTSAFRSVSRWSLDELVLRDSANTVHSTDIIIDPSGRRLVLLLTDATAAGWYEEQVWHVLERWAKAMPTVLVHLLPRSYWGYTATGQPTATVRSRRPAGPNSSAEAITSWWSDDPDPTDVPVPIISLHEEDIARWAAAVSSGSTWADAVWACPPETAASRPSKLTAADRVRTFQARASVSAQDLAQVLAGAPVLSLPLIRVLHEHLVPAPETEQLAEVLVSGLLENVSGDADSTSTLLRFRPGVADLLYQGTTTSQEWDVYEILTQHLERNVSTGNAVRAVLADPHGSATVDGDLVPFAAMGRGAATRLGVVIPMDEVPPGDEASVIGLQPIASNSAAVPVIRGTSGIVCVPDASPPLSAAHIADSVIRELISGLLSRGDTDTATMIEDGGVSVTWYDDLFSPDDVERRQTYFTDREIRRAAQDRLAALITDDTRVIVAHSFGAIVAYEALSAHPQWPVRTLVTVGAPLGNPSVVDRLDPPPRRLTLQRDRWPENITSWTDIVIRDDAEAAGYDLRDLFGDKVVIQLASGVRPDDTGWHLAAPKAVSAISKALLPSQTTPVAAATRTSGSRRFLVSCVVDYSASVLTHLPRGTGEAAEMVVFLRSLGYEHVPLAPGNQTRSRILEDLLGFVQDPDRSPGDSVLFYLSGQAVVSHGRYFFLPADTVPDQLDATGISVDDFNSTLFATSSIVRQLLVIDTDAAGLAVDQLNTAARKFGSSYGRQIAVIGSTRAAERASQTGFAPALAHAVQESTDGEFTISGLVDRINQFLLQRSGQSAVSIEYGLTSSYGSAFFSTQRVDHNRAIEQITHIGDPLKVFIAYTQDSRAHTDAVCRLADLLLSNGMELMIDLYAEDKRQDWNEWTHRQILESDFIIVVASPMMRTFGDRTTSPDRNQGVQAAMASISDLFQRDQLLLTRVLPVVLPGGTLDGLPDFVSPHTTSSYFVQDLTPDGIDDLLRAIANQPTVERQRTEARKQQVEHKKRQLAARVEELDSILQRGLNRPSAIDPRSLIRRSNVPPLDLGDLGVPIPAPDWSSCQPPAPGAVSRLFGGQRRYDERLSAARTAFDQAMRARDVAETERQRRVALARQEHAERVQGDEAAVRDHNEKIKAWAANLDGRQKAAVEEYYGIVLNRVPLPSGCPHKAEVAYSPQHEQVVVQFELPARDVVPTDGGYQYLTTKDEERSTPRKPKEIADLYRSLISQIALLCIRDLLHSDQHVQAVAFNGHVHAVNPATGKREYPCIISLNVDRAYFPRDPELREVNPGICVRHLKAIVSNHPYELEPIEPILNFDLSKYPFVQELDAVATLDSRPDLLQMSATNFEHLVRQLFEAQGLQGWTTTQSNDDGVDAVITNKTSIVDGVAIVQAKRYSIAVGINHIRELAGAIEEKKAGKGILVTTSWFTPKCWEKSREHGRMELIDGERLVYLIKEHLGKDVLIGIAKRPRPHQSATD